MKVAILSESPADEAAIRILIDGIIGGPTQPADMPPIRTRGVSGVFTILPTVLKHLHYRTDADALVIVVDSDRHRCISQSLSKLAALTRVVGFAKYAKPLIRFLVNFELFRDALRLRLQAV